MLHKLFCGARIGHGSCIDVAAGPEAINEKAIDALAELEALYAMLSWDRDYQLDIGSEVGYRTCAEFLTCVVATSEAMRIQPASRAYRQGFSVNYRILFPDESRSYRVDLLGATHGQCAMIWVNGDKFEFSSEASCLAQKLQDAWKRLCLTLDHRAATTLPANREGVVEVAEVLANLDVAWAAFEAQYILELMGIEERARGLIVDAIQCELHLQSLENQADMHAPLSTEFLSERRRMIGHIARLNSVANFQGKGRGDFCDNVLEKSLATVRNAIASQRIGALAATRRQAELEVAASLGADVVESFQAMRDYLFRIRNFVSRVDPHLRNNAGLVERLVDFEDSYEIGLRYVCDAEVREDVCKLVIEIRSVAKTVPSAAAMLQSCAVELFLWLPRMVWLRYLFCRSPATGEDASDLGAGLLRSLLPHRFAEQAAEGVDELAAKFELAASCICSALRRPALQQGGSPLLLASASTGSIVRRLFILRALSGDSVSDRIGEMYAAHFVRGQKRLAAIEAIESLMLRLEGFSMELQRSCPEDWNQCASVLVMLLSEDSGEKKEKTLENFRI